MEAVRVYETKDEWVEWVKIDDKVYLSAHTTNKRYSRAMLKAIFKTFLQFKDIYTILPSLYLVDFYKNHANVELIDKEIKAYRIWRS